MFKTVHPYLPVTFGDKPFNNRFYILSKQWLLSITGESVLELVDNIYEIVVFLK